MTLTTQETAEVLAGFDMAMVAALPEKPATDAPPANSLIRLIASAYGVDDEIACQWLCVRQDDFEAWIPPLGAVA